MLGCRELHGLSPSAASPTTSIAGACSSRPTMPARTIGWSSATTMRMGSVTSRLPWSRCGCGAGIGSGHDDLERSSRLGPGRLERAADEGGAVAMPARPNPCSPGTTSPGPMPSSATVSTTSSSAAVTATVARPSPRVLAHVRERLLAERGARPRARGRATAASAGLDRHAGLALERRREPPQRLGEPGVGLDRRERGDEPARLGERLASHLLHELDVAARGCRGVAVDPLESVAGPLRHHHEPVRLCAIVSWISRARRARSSVTPARGASRRAGPARPAARRAAGPFLAVRGDPGDPQAEGDAEADRQHRDAEPGEDAGRAERVADDDGHREGDVRDEGPPRFVRSTTRTGRGTPAGTRTPARTRCRRRGRRRSRSAMTRWCCIGRAVDVSPAVGEVDDEEGARRAQAAELVGAVGRLGEGEHDDDARDDDRREVPPSHAQHGSPSPRVGAGSRVPPAADARFRRRAGSSGRSAG